jgi:hypothetical protein
MITTAQPNWIGDTSHFQKLSELVNNEKCIERCYFLYLYLALSAFAPGKL